MALSGINPLVAAAVAEAMALAGRVAVVPQKEYNLQRVYERLDMVRYQNRVYVAIKGSTGILPTNEDYWMLSMTNDASSEEVIQLLPVGETSLDFTFNNIKNGSTITVQTDIPTVSYTDVQVSGNTVTVKFDPQTAGVYVQVTVSERPVSSDSYTTTETKVLAVGGTEVTFTVDNLSPNSTISVQTDNPKAYYTKLEISGNTITVFFDAVTIETQVRAVVAT